MIIPLQETDLELVLDFKMRTFEASRRYLPPLGWRERSTELYLNLYRKKECLHLGYQADNRMVALAGALLCDEPAFLSTQVVRYGVFIDEYALPEYSNQNIAEQLRQPLRTWLAEKGARLTTNMPPNLSRLACAATNFRW